MSVRDIALAAAGVTTASGAAYRYWAILATAHSGDPQYASLNEVEWRVAGVDVTTPAAPVVASAGQFISYGPNNLVSNNLSEADPSNVWISAVSPTYPYRLSFDLGVPQAVTQVALYPYTAAVNRAPGAFEVQASHDGVTWVTLKQYSNLSAGWSAAFRTFSTDPTVGQVAYTTPGTYSWTVPDGVTSVCVVCVGGGAGTYFYSGGALSYGNNIPVTPGSSVSLKVGAGGNSSVGGDSWFISSTHLTAQGGQISTGGTSSGSLRTGGGSGGAAGSIGATPGGGGAGGYSGDGGAGEGGNQSGSGGGGGGGSKGATGSSSSSGGGGVGLLGEGASGAANLGGSGGENQGSDGLGYGGDYGGGAGNSYGGGSSAIGGDGAVRIIWGAGRAFPSTLTGDL